MISHRMRRENDLLINAIAQAEHRAIAAGDTAAVDRFRVMRRAATEKTADVGAVLRQRWLNAPWLMAYGHPDRPYKWSDYQPEQRKIESAESVVAIAAGATLTVIGLATYAYFKSRREE